MLEYMTMRLMLPIPWQCIKFYEWDWTHQSHGIQALKPPCAVGRNVPPGQSATCWCCSPSRTLPWPGPPCCPRPRGWRGAGGWCSAWPSLRMLKRISQPQQDLLLLQSSGVQETRKLKKLENYWSLNLFCFALSIIILISGRQIIFS